jgi:hypothetical protein
MSSTTQSAPWVGTAAPTPWITEDWLSVALGLFILTLALGGLVGADLLGWTVVTTMWTDPGKALGTVSRAYASLGGASAFILTYLALLAVLSAGVAALKADVRRFAATFTVLFWIAYASWIIGTNAHFAAVTPTDLQRFGIGWSFKLTNEGGYIFALIAGLIIANGFPRFAEWLKDAVRPELYIKIAIVLLGAYFAVTIAGPPSSRPI